MTASPLRTAMEETAVETNVQPAQVPPRQPSERGPWSWVPSLYFTEGLPYAVVMVVSVVMYKRLGISNTDIALYTSWLYLPWVIKPFWSPLVDVLRTKRFWAIAMQLLLGAGFAGVALTVPAEPFFQYTLAFLWLLAFASATHDVAADGFYMLALSEHDQAWFVGIRSTFYRLAMIAGQGLLLMLAGYLEARSGDLPLAWSLTFFLLAGLFVAFPLWHGWALPRPPTDRPAARGSGAVLTRYLGFLALFVPLLAVLLVPLVVHGLVRPRARGPWGGLFQRLPFSDTPFAQAIVSFFLKPEAGVAVAFVLFYRFAEAQLVKLASPFLLDSAEAGGLALTTAEVGFVYGTVGVAALTLGGILGGFLVARDGLKAWLWPMGLAINVPNAAYLFLATARPENFFVINAAVAVEQFGYGFGFTAFLLYLIYVAEGEFKTAHYAIGTGLMALGMMLPGMFSGWLQELIGYPAFFAWVLIATAPSFLVTALVRVDPAFGKREDAPAASLKAPA